MVRAARHRGDGRGLTGDLVLQGGEFGDERNTSGWARLTVKTNPVYADELTMWGAGYLEGRRVRKSREMRAMARRTDFGKQVTGLSDGGVIGDASSDRLAGNVGSESCVEGCSISSGDSVDNNDCSQTAWMASPILNGRVTTSRMKESMKIFLPALRAISETATKVPVRSFQMER